jgi:predicted nucleotidyltransferase component of viral defense system
MPNYLHDHKDFADLIKILAEEKGIEPGLVEKDYWIMHVLYGLKRQGFDFELKGGTSLSKGYKIIHRFSEDIDIHIKPLEKFGINENPKNTNENNAKKRKAFYDWLADEIKIPGIIKAVRDFEFDEIENYRSGGIRLFYNNLFDKVEGSKEGVLLEAGFDDVTPNDTLTITSWAYDRAVEKGVKIEDNKAVDIKCYHPGYTFVEKLQTISTKFRTEQADPTKKSKNLMRQYYDVYCLLDYKPVLEFIGTEAYAAHKERRFRAGDKAVSVQENQGFLLTDKAIREEFSKRYLSTAKLYYQGQPPFEELMARIASYIQNL